MPLPQSKVDSLEAPRKRTAHKAQTGKSELYTLSYSSPVAEIVKVAPGLPTGQCHSSGHFWFKVCDHTTKKLPNK